jgi:putative redox protein
MYADRKQIALGHVEVTVSLEWDKNINETIMIKNIHLSGNISEDERERLLQIASKCPTHKMLQHPVQIITSVT